MELLPVSVVERWFNAINAPDYELLFSTVADDVEVMTANGCLRGAAAIDMWLDFAAEPFRWFCGPPGLVVVEQVACWWFSPTTMERVIASAFRVFNGRIVRYRRFDDLPQALAATSLTDDDEVLASGVPLPVFSADAKPSLRRAVAHHDDRVCRGSLDGHQHRRHGRRDRTLDRRHGRSTRR